MRKIEDVLRLHARGLSTRRIALATGVGKTTVIEYLRRATTAGLSWPLPEGLGDETLERRLFPPPPSVKDRQCAEPDWAAVHRELKRAGVTLAVLWDEYRGQHLDGYGYSAFCEITAAGRGGSRRSCASVMSRGSGCSSTIPEPGCRSPTRRRASSVRQRSSSP